MPSFRAVLTACAATGLVLVAACSDSTSVPVQPVPDAPSQLRFVCRADVQQGSVECAPPGAAAGVRADRILGTGTGVKLTSSNITVVADSFAFDMTVTNNFEFPIGTTDGVNPDPNGIRVFFVDGIHTTSGTGSVTVVNADGVGTFTATGQAYFAYPGVLQPAATTAPRRWKLRFDPGVLTFTFGLYVSTPVPPGGGGVWLKIIDPKPNQVFTDTMVIHVKVDSASASIQSVKAFLADLSVVLTTSPEVPGVLTGRLSLASLPYGTYQLRVHGVTVRADTGNAYVTIIKDAPPTLTVTNPTGTNMVARPNLRVDADCVDDDPAGCASLTVKAGDLVIASGTSGIHADVSLSAMNETQQYIQIIALDSRGRERRFTRYVYVQSGPPVFVDSAGSMAMDADSSRLLFADTANTIWLHDRAGGTRTVLQASSIGNLSGFLFPLGALFAREGSGHLYEWRNGTVVDLSIGVAGSLVVKGNWATWYNVTNGGAGRRDLVAGTSEFISGARNPHIGPNGALVYDDDVANGGRVYLLGTSTGAVLVDSVTSRKPLTDGNLVVYAWFSSLKMWDGATRTELTSSPGGYTPHTNYEINAGWIAYTVLDGGGATQLRVRNPGGTDTQVTSFSNSSVIRALSAEGTLVYARGGSIYALRAPYTAAPTRIARDWFRAVRFRGTELQLYLGNTVFSASY
jgi:hypothetical protein